MLAPVMGWYVAHASFKSSAKKLKEVKIMQQDNGVEKYGEGAEFEET